MSVKRGFADHFVRGPKAFFAALVALVTVAVVIATGMASASACEPLIEAGANCDGTVSFTARAWNDASATDELRTNRNVQIQYSINGVNGPFETVTSTGAKYQFTKSNDFSFSDKFSLPANLKRPTAVTVRAVAVAKWGTDADLDVANQSSKTTIRVVECATPSAKITGPTCASKVAIAALTNPSTEPIEFKLYRDGSPTPFDTVTVADGFVSRNITVSGKTSISIAAPGMKTIEQDLNLPTNCVTQPNVGNSGSKVDSSLVKTCKVEGSAVSVTYDNLAGLSTREFVLLVDEKVTDTVEVPAGKSVPVSYAFTDLGIEPGDSAMLTVKVGEKTLGSETVVNDCVLSSAGIAAACDTPAGSGAVLSFQNTGQVADTFTVVRDGKVVEGSPFTLEPSDRITQKLLKLNNGETATIAIVSASGLNVQEEITLNCESATGNDVDEDANTEVKAQTISRVHLADTGYAMWPEVALGAFLVTMGVASLGARRFV